MFVLVVAGVLFLFPSVRNTIVIKSSDVLTIFDQAISIPFSVIESKSNDIKNLSKINDENISLKSKIYQIDINHSKLNRLESENNELKDLLNLKIRYQVQNKLLGRLLTEITVLGMNSLLLIRGVLMEFQTQCLFFLQGCYRSC